MAKDAKPSRFKPAGDGRRTARIPTPANHTLNVSVRFSPELHSWLRERAFRENSSIQQMVVTAMERERGRSKA